MTFPIFFGALVLLAGLTILLDAVFKIHLPLVRTAFALLFIFLGVRMLIGAWSSGPKESAPTGAAVMSELQFAPTKPAPVMKYDVIFGQGAIDLTRMSRPELSASVEVNVIFGSATLTVDPSWPIAIEGSSAFGEVRMPDQSTATFGTARFRTSEAEPILRVRVNAVFGSCHVLTSHARAERPGPVSAVMP